LVPGSEGRNQPLFQVSNADELIHDPRTTRVGMRLRCAHFPFLPEHSFVKTTIRRSHLSFDSAPVIAHLVDQNVDENWIHGRNTAISGRIGYRPPLVRLLPASFPPLSHLFPTSFPRGKDSIGRDFAQDLRTWALFEGKKVPTMTITLLARELLPLSQAFAQW